MNEHAQLDITALVEEINAAEDDPMWRAWTKDRLRLQDQLHELRAVRDALARKLRGTKVIAEVPDPRPTATVPATWLTKAEVATSLHVSLRTVERMMSDTPDHIRKPWAKVGRTVRWEPAPDRITRWVEELAAWQASRNADQSGSSDGGTRRVARSREPAQRAGRRMNSASKSRSNGRTGGTGDRRLTKLAESLTSKKS